MMTRNPQMNTEYKLRLKVNEVIAEAKKNGDLDKLALKWLGRPAGDLPQ